MNYIKTYIIAAILIASMKSSSAQWVKLNSGISNDFYSVYFTSEDTGYVVGDSGTILKTEDGGNNWNILVLGINSRINSVFFTSSTTGYACTMSGKILKTTNRGTSWDVITDELYGLNAIYFLNQDTGIAAGNNRTFFYTDNGGNTWTKAPVSGPVWIDGNPDYYAIDFVDNNTGYAVGGGFSNPPLTHGEILQTIDGGKSWSALPDTIAIGTSSVIYSINCVNNVTCFAGNRFGLAYTINDITDWYHDTISVSNYVIKSIFFGSQYTGYFAAGPFIAKTTDSHQSWIKDSVTSNTLNDMHFPSNNVGYAVGTNGTILKTTNAGLSVNENNLKNNDGYFSCYPNPFNNKIYFTYNLSTTQHITLSIYDIVGSEVVRIADNTLMAPNQTINYEASNLPAGLYLFKSKTENFCEVKKLIKIR